MASLLGIDIGTSSAKGVVIDESGRVQASAAAHYPLSQPRPGWSEQEPEDWWKATVAVCGQLLASGKTRAADIKAVGLSGQMHGSVFLDRASVTGGGEHAGAVRPALLWNDQRTGAQCQAIERAVGGRRQLVSLVGNAALTGFTLPKILWLREHEPEAFARTAKVVLPKDFVRLRLTGEVATDVGDAAGTLLFDIDARTWSQAVRDAVRLDPGLFPAHFESAQVTGGVTRWASQQTGLAAGTPVVGGSGDNQSGAVGAGVVSPGMVLATLGTSGVIYAHADKPRKDLPPDAAPADAPCGRLHTMCAADGDGRTRGHWCVTGVMLSAAGSLQWVRDSLFPDATFEALTGEAASVEPGCEGLVFLPYLSGERCPHPDPMARGGWVGLTRRHTRAHLVRAVIEGVTFAMGQILDLVRATGVEVGAVRLGGGGARSALWRQVQADVYGVPVTTTNTEEGPAFGAALMAGVGAGVWASVPEACAATIVQGAAIEPSASASKYRRAREVFEELYPALRSAMHALSDQA